MRGIGIYDLSNGHLSFDLRELLEVLGSNALSAWWRIRTSVWYVTEGDVAIPALDADEPPGPWMRGDVLLAVARAINQVVDGVIEGVRSDGLPLGEADPWVVLRAVDSSFWEVYTDDPLVLEAIQQQFSDIRAAQFTPHAPATYY